MAVIIFENLKGWTRTDMALKAGEHLTPFMLGKFDDVIAQLLKQKPIQYIFGNAWFYGMKLTVTPDTLIPRPETAEMVDFIVQENQRKDLRVIDLCTGSGCIAIALARNLPFATVTASDISAKALDVARGNARTLYADVRFVQSDLLTARGREALAGNYDIIVSNPPYIAEKEKAGMSANVLDYELIRPCSCPTAIRWSFTTPYSILPTAISLRVGKSTWKSIRCMPISCAKTLWRGVTPMCAWCATATGATVSCSSPDSPPVEPYATEKERNIA